MRRKRAKFRGLFQERIRQESSELGSQFPNVYGWLDLKVEHHWVKKRDKIEPHEWFDSKDDAPEQPSLHFGVQPRFWVGKVHQEPKLEQTKLDGFPYGDVLFQCGGHN